MAHKGLSLRTRMNWLIDAGVFTSAVLAAITGIYFLFLPTGGYRGGRNPAYGITILFDRHTWEDWHDWTGIAMIAIVLIHLALHWPWIVTMTKRTLSTLFGTTCSLSKGSWINIGINATIAVSFIGAAISGLYFFFIPAKTPWLFDATLWDLIHTWTGIALIVAAILHFAIHWRWIVNVTTKFFGVIWQPTHVELIKV